MVVVYGVGGGAALSNGRRGSLLIRPNNGNNCSAMFTNQQMPRGGDANHSEPMPVGPKACSLNRGGAGCRFFFARANFVAQITP